MEFIVEVLVMILLRYPGALIRWLYFGGKKEYKELLNDKNPNVNSYLSLFFIIVVLSLFFIIKKVINK